MRLIIKTVREILIFFESAFKLIKIQKKSKL